MFERFFEVARAGLQFAEQPRVLHCDDGLVGKGLDELELGGGEGLDLAPEAANDVDPSQQIGTPKAERKAITDCGPSRMRAS
jgi:hypothetical protein